MRTRSRDILFVLAGVAGLVLKGRYSGPYVETVWSYGGNIAVSFAVYFLAARLAPQGRFNRAWNVALALAVVELFEFFDGFGVMANVYDRMDFAANALGVAIALAVDEASRALSRRSADSGSEEGPSIGGDRPLV